LLDFSNNRDPIVRESVVRALGQIGEASPEVVGAVRRQLAGPLRLSGQVGISPRLQVVALQSLVMLAGDSTRTFSDVVSFLNDRNLAVRVQALLAVSRFSGKRREVIERSIELLNDEDPYIRTASALTLGQIGPEAADALPALRSFLRDGRNHVPNPLRPKTVAGGPNVDLQFVPGGKDFHRLSVAKAAEWAISAIESPTPRTSGAVDPGAGEQDAP
jgi:HEAT repeat protein